MKTGLAKMLGTAGKQSDKGTKDRGRVFARSCHRKTKPRSPPLLPKGGN